jgi:hypothetical protein
MNFTQSQSAIPSASSGSLGQRDHFHQVGKLHPRTVTPQILISGVAYTFKNTPAPAGFQRNV